MAVRPDPAPVMPRAFGWPEVAALLGTLAIIGLWWL